MVDLYLQGKECVLSIVVVKVRVIEISARDYRGLESLNGASGLNVYLRNIRRIGEYWKYGTKGFIFWPSNSVIGRADPGRISTPLYRIVQICALNDVCVCVLRVGKTKQ